MLTGFGPFVAVYLASQKWTQLDATTIDTIVRAKLRSGVLYRILAHRG